MLRNACHTAQQKQQTMTNDTKKNWIIEKNKTTHPYKGDRKEQDHKHTHTHGGKGDIKEQRNARLTASQWSGRKSIESIHLRSKNVLIGDSSDRPIYLACVCVSVTV